MTTATEWEHYGHDLALFETDSRSWATTWNEETGVLEFFDSSSGDGEGDYRGYCRTCEHDTGKHTPIESLPDSIEIDYT